MFKKSAARLAPPQPGRRRYAGLLLRAASTVAVSALAVAVPAAAEAASVPGVPGHVTATVVSPSAIKVTWSSVSGATSYVVSDGSVSSADLTSTSYTWGGLAPGTYMCFTVTAKNSAGQSPWSTYSCTTTSVPTPTNVTATATSPDNVHITWTDAAAPGASFVISDGVFTAGSTSPGVTQFNWNGIDPNTYMCFTIAAKEGNGQSPWSSYACTTTFPGDPWDQPVDWFAHAGGGGQSDPINIVLTGTSTVDLATVYNWLNAETGPTLTNAVTGASYADQNWQQATALGLTCMNSLSADVDSLGGNPIDGYIDQEMSVREGGCGAILDDYVDHFRAWSQVSTGATFIAASTEVPCVTFVPPSVSHCVTDYDGGRDQLVNDIESGANVHGLPVNVQYVTEYSAGTVTQLDGSAPGYDGQVAVITIG